MSETMHGSCQCGGVRYEVTGPPMVSLVCHCRDCQKLSASAYSPTLVFPSEAFRVEGRLERWESRADSGTRKHAYFCPRCGNRIYHQDPDQPSTVRLKAGTLDGPIPAPQAHVWVSRKQPWVTLPDGVPTFEGNAVDLAAVLRRASREQG
jgi:hypothetical protein